MAQNIQLRSDAVVLRRPHFRLEQAELFSFDSKSACARLSMPEAQVWSALDSGASVEALRESLKEQADSAITRLIELGACELARAHFPNGRRRVLVIEPHSDDAVLSVGGTMWLRSEDCEFTIATVGSRSNYTRCQELTGCEFFSIEKICALRAAEGALAARLLGGHHVALGETDTLLRYRDGDWTPDWFSQHHMSVRLRTNRLYGPADLQNWTAAIHRLLSDSDAEEIWMPLGVAPHTDHQLTRNACLSAILKDPSVLRGRPLKLYQEVPYAGQNPNYTAALVKTLSHAGAVLAPEPVPVDAVFDEKVRLLSIFASQYAPVSARSVLEPSARLGAGPGLSELLWKLEHPPTVLEELSLCPDAPAISQMAERLSGWLPRYRNVGRVRVLLLLPSGRWVEDMTVLLRCFPSATLDVYVAPAGAQEVLASPSPRICVHQTGAGIQAWVKLAMRLMVARPAPTLFLAGTERLREANILSLLWPMSSTLVLGSMDQFILAAQQVTSSGADAS